MTDVPSADDEVVENHIPEAGKMVSDDELLLELWEDMFGNAVSAKAGNYTITYNQFIEHAKAAINRLYVPRQKVVEAIGPDSNPDPYDPDFVSSGEIEDIKLEGQNELRAEIREKLGLDK
jgi:hypothetical protein